MWSVFELFFFWGPLLLMAYLMLLFLHDKRITNFPLGQQSLSDVKDQISFNLPTQGSAYQVTQHNKTRGDICFTLLLEKQVKTIFFKEAFKE